MIELNVNGQRHAVAVLGDKSLLQVLRDDLDLTGCKFGCGEGQCGACTVLVDGEAIRSCITPASAATGKHITTVESLENNGRLHPVQQAFLDADAMQCGYCTTGMIMNAVGLLRKNPTPTEADIRRAMQGNLCRCGTYNRIVAAIHAAAHRGGAS
ncbi:MAG TPA: (2Fe-2S)-binding protein [Chloroflexota bacterium]|nr:(2Fe-2S)-binding protein [Chloroflexota bacterium]